MPQVRRDAEFRAPRVSADVIRRDYAPLAAYYETRWRAFSQSARDWVLARWPDLSAAARVVDLGCGAGGFLAALEARHPELRLVGLDITPALLVRARVAAPSARLVEGDVESPPFADRTFDVVCSLNVLHHLNDPRRHVAALARLAQPGATIFLATFAGGRTLGMRLADWWLRMRNPAWRGMVTAAALRGMLAGEPNILIADQTQIKADAWWWLQLYRLEVGLRS